MSQSQSMNNNNNDNNNNDKQLRMSAVTFAAYGRAKDVLRVSKVPLPSIKDGQVRVAVHASSLNGGDLHLIHANPFLIRFMTGLFKPNKLVAAGSDFAGTVVECGAGVTEFKVGDQVFGESSNCGFSAFAEQVCVPVTAVTNKPKSLTMVETACLPIAALTALEGLRDYGTIKPGERVLVIGAGGGVGSMAVQIAKAYGCHVTGVCRGKHAAMVSQAGADIVIDFERDDYLTLGQTWDCVFDAACYRPIRSTMRVLNPAGRFVHVGGAGLGSLLRSLFLKPFYSMFSTKSVHLFVQSCTAPDLRELAQLCDAGKLKPCLTRTVTLDGVASAMDDFENHNIFGKVGVSIVDDADDEHSALSSVGDDVRRH